jgi:hypothetical protein
VSVVIVNNENQVKITVATCNDSGAVSYNELVYNFDCELVCNFDCDVKTSPSKVHRHNLLSLMKC